MDSNQQQFVLALMLVVAVVGFLFYGTWANIIDKEIMMFILGQITAGFILAVQFYFRRGKPQ